MSTTNCWIDINESILEGENKKKPSNAVKKPVPISYKSLSHLHLWSPIFWTESRLHLQFCMKRNILTSLRTSSYARNERRLKNAIQMVVTQMHRQWYTLKQIIDEHI